MEHELEAMRNLVYQGWQVRDAIMASACKDDIWKYLGGHGDFYTALNEVSEILTKHGISIDPGEQND